MKAGKIIGRVVATQKYKNMKGKKILMLKPMSWEKVHKSYQNGREDNVRDEGKSILALDAVGAGSSEYVFYVSSKEACQAFEDVAICNHAVVGIIDGLHIEQ